MTADEIRYSAAIVELSRAGLRKSFASRAGTLSDHARVYRWVFARLGPRSGHGPVQLSCLYPGAAQTCSYADLLKSAGHREVVPYRSPAASRSKVALARVQLEHDSTVNRGSEVVALSARNSSTRRCAIKGDSSETSVGEFRFRQLAK